MTGVLPETAVARRARESGAALSTALKTLADGPVPAERPSTSRIPPRPLRMTAGEVRVALRAHFPHPEYGTLYEVAQGTGWASNRRIDALVMSLWPSRGLHLYGIEIKVDRGDWRRELANPAKAEELAAFCDFFYVAAPRGVVPAEELPENWGLLECHESGVRRAKIAAKLEAPKNASRMFLAALFRAAMRAPDPETQDAEFLRRVASINDAADRRIAEEVERRAKRDNAAAESWRRLCAALGERDSQWLDDAAIIAAVRAVKRARVGDTYNGLHALRGHLSSALDRVNEGLALFPKPDDAE
ncbi:MAG TPA: hypothetical protein VKR31_03905 [Rhizomicrobium sp.]|nr:hypothetical protein [Rhizomicrobium sp.]